MEFDKFQEFMAGQFAKMLKEVQDFRKDVSVELADIKGKLELHDERFDSLEEQIAKLGALDRSDIENVARQAEKLMVGQESFRTETRNTLEKMQFDINYLVRKTSTHDDDIMQLKKAK
jgi:predicted phage gp36 major capsid-like protein